MIGSLGMFITSVVVVINKLTPEPILSDDDSLLSPSAFVASWILLAASGLFSMLGSIAVVRAFHEGAFAVADCYSCASWVWFIL